MLVLKGAPFRVGRRSDSSVMMTRRKRIKTRTATKASHKCDPTNPAPPVTRTRLAPVLGFVLMTVFPFSSIFLYRSLFTLGGVLCVVSELGSFLVLRKERMKKRHKKEKKKPNDQFRCFHLLWVESHVSLITSRFARVFALLYFKRRNSQSTVR